MTYTRKIGLVFALPCELSGLERVLEDTYVSSWQRGPVVTWRSGQVDLMVMVSGIGARQSADAAEALMWAGAEIVLCAGLAAGLDPSAGVGDVVVANRVLSLEYGGEDVRCNPGLTSFLPPSGAIGFPIKSCDLATSGRVVRSRDEKARINRLTGAAALDMESFAAGDACARRGVPFAAIRAISDTAEQDLPEVVPALVATHSSLRRLALALAAPQSWIGLLRLRGQTQKATQNLGEALATMVARLS